MLERTGIAWYRAIAEQRGIRGVASVWWMHHGIGSKRRYRQWLVASDAGWEEVGAIPVDSGCITLTDPAHLADLAVEAEEFIRSFAGGPDTGWNGIIARGGGSRQVATDGYPTAVEVLTGYGDGMYPVEVRRNEEGRVAEVRVVFL